MAMLRFLRSHKGTKVSPSRVLEAAISSGDTTLFYTCYKFFEQRKLLGSNDCHPYTAQFRELFDVQPK